MTRASFSINQRRNRKVPVTEIIPGEQGQRQVLNNAGGYAFAVDSWQRLRRFLILGTEGGTYYVGQKELDTQNIDNLKACLTEDYKKTIDEIVEVSDKGLAPKNDPAIFALALAAASTNIECKAYARGVIGRVCRIPTHLFAFIQYYHQVGGGWNRGLRSALSEWYNKPIDKIVYHLVKYQQREGWSNKDILRLVHPKPYSPKHNAAFRWAIGAEVGEREVKSLRSKNEARYYSSVRPDIPALIVAYEDTKNLAVTNKANRDTLVQYINEYGLTHEMIPTEGKKYPEVWEALMAKMPLTALIRNLGNIGKVGLLDLKAPRVEEVCNRITDPSALKHSRIHPLAILLALRTYGQGAGMRGRGEWYVNPDVADALEKAFYAAFDFVEPTGKLIMHSIDVSGSMHGTQVCNNLMKAHEAAAVLMMTSLKKESGYVSAFDTNCRMLSLRGSMSLEQVLDVISHAGAGGTDVSSPIRFAQTHLQPVDAFVLYTDSETWYGGHPQQYLDQYKRSVNPDVKAVIVSMTATHVTALDTQDKSVLQVVGFDTSVPQVMHTFLTS